MNHGNFHNRSQSLGGVQDPAVNLSIQSSQNYAQSSFLKTQNLQKFGARKVKLNEAKEVLNDYYNQIKSPKYDGPTDVPKEFKVPMYKNPTIRLTSKSPSY